MCRWSGFHRQYRAPRHYSGIRDGAPRVQPSSGYGADIVFIIVGRGLRVCAIALSERFQRTLLAITRASISGRFLGFHRVGLAAAALDRRGGLVAGNQVARELEAPLGEIRRALG
jgi:hypothetical protein